MHEELTALEQEHQAELRASAAAGLRVACVIGILAFVAFAFIDPLLVEVTAVLLGTRVAVVVLLLGLLAASFTEVVPRHPIASNTLACVVIGLGVVAVTAQVGGASTTYHEALVLTVVGFSVLPVPWRWQQALPLFAGVVLAYGLTMALTGQTGAMANWVTANTILWLAVAVASAVVFLTGRLRAQEFEGRVRLAEANLQLQELDRVKSRFFANLSHELRTPLTLALAPIDALLADGRANLSPMHRDNLELARRSALRLLHLVDDLLALSHLEAAALKLKPKPVDLRALVTRLLDEVRPLARRKSIAVVLEDGPTVRTIHGDVEQLDRVFLNLLANALKFTPEGGRIQVRVTNVEGQAVVEVSDTGIGIPQDQLDAVFERFHQVDGSATRSTGGSGIGLSLVRELVALHGGQVVAESTVGVGTTMRCSFPVQPDAAEVSDLPTLDEEEVAEGLPEWHEELRRGADYRLLGVDAATERRLIKRRRPDERLMTVLVIEDNPDMIRFIGGLMGADYNVLTALDGRTGLRLAHEHQPDLIISDVMMPGMTGFEVLASLKESPELCTIPVMLLTARGEVDDRVLGHGQGADVYLTKPFQVSELLAAVQGLLKKQGVRADAEEEKREEGLDTLLRGISRALRPPLRQLEQQLGPAEVDAHLDVVALRNAGGELRLLLDELDLMHARAAPGPQLVLTMPEVATRVLSALPSLDSARIVSSHSSERPVLAAPGELERIVHELLANALRASPREIPIHLSSRDEASGMVLLEVRDSGPGVPAVHRERIFTPFYSTRPDGSLSGVGLSVARGLARRLGGTLRLEPDGAEAGSVFLLRLPCGPAPRETWEPQPPATPGGLA